MPKSNGYNGGDKVRKEPRQQSKRQAKSGRRMTEEGISKNRAARRRGIKKAPPKGMTKKFRDQLECAWIYVHRTAGKKELAQMLDEMRATDEVTLFLEFADFGVQLVRIFGKQYEDKLELLATEVLKRELAEIILKEDQDRRNVDRRRKRSPKRGYVNAHPRLARAA